MKVLNVRKRSKGGRGEGAKRGGRGWHKWTAGGYYGDLAYRGSQILLLQQCQVPHRVVVVERRLTFQP
jgi:hypothetical protein